MSLSDSEIKAIADEVVRQLLPKLVGASVQVGGQDEEFVSVRDRIEAAEWARNELRSMREKKARRVALGARLRDGRIKENLSLNQLSDMSGILEQHISDMEDGRRVIGREKAIRLAKALKLDYNDIYISG